MPLAKVEASLVLRAASFAVSDIRDIVYALLHLANDAGASPQSESIASEDVTLTADYTRHAVDVFTDFVRYCMDKSGSFDISVSLGQCCHPRITTILTSTEHCPLGSV